MAESTEVNVSVHVNSALPVGIGSAETLGCCSCQLCCVQDQNLIGTRTSSSMDD